MTSTLRVETIDRVVLTSAQRKQCISPRDLVRDRGLDQSMVGDGIAFIDDVLGYIIFRVTPECAEAEDNDAIRSPGRHKAVLPGVHNFKIMLEDMKADEAWALSPAVLPATSDRWYLPQDFGLDWPAGTGLGQRVAVLDSGIHASIGALPRRPDHADFCSCSGTSVTTHSIGFHGTLCAGVIAAKSDSGRRRAVAPDCLLVVAQTQRWIDEGVGVQATLPFTNLVDVLLMVSWAVHRWNARTISLSFRAKTEGVDEGRDILGDVAKRLRRLDRALMFCAAAENSASLSYPANAAGVVAVGMYCPLSTHDPSSPRLAIIKSLKLWVGKQDLLFAPGSDLLTIRPDRTVDNFSGSSGACAFAAGVAALYMEAYPSLNVDEILALMKGNAVKIPRAPSGSPRWSALQFPRRGPACAPRRLFWQLWRWLRRMWKADDPEPVSNYRRPLPCNDRVIGKRPTRPEASG